MSAKTASTRPWWAEVWPDAFAFVLGLGIAWWSRWKTTDLVWSLWLSSLCVGYAIIVVTIFRPVVQIIVASGKAVTTATKGQAAGAAVVDTLALGGGLFMLAFFTVHFGGFHFVHSIFLDQFFPVTGQPERNFHMWPVYAEVFRRYWPFLAVTAIAERAAFRERPKVPDTGAVTPEAIARRKAQAGMGMAEPYNNVIRMHLLIFFFAFAHFVHLENFAVYAVVYFVYFFPWRLLRREKIPAASTA